ncbi:hypothetical protein AGMMS4957_15310 [Bacteroidia bacterium]|nr:hypothetical protein AGMMS4957_15310 [Bacteroidia bacterium]
MNKEEKEKVPEVLYKYRSLENWQWFVDILLINRLYAAKYKDLNDPMEGKYYYHSGQLDEKTRDKLRDEKANLRICSLSETSDNSLMWSHYANGHKGVAIGVAIDDKRYDVGKIHYDGQSFVKQKDFSDRLAKEILQHKSDIWKYENEWRVFSDDYEYIDVKIIDIILGNRMDDKDKKYIRNLVDRINPDIRVKEQF